MTVSACVLAFRTGGRGPGGRSRGVRRRRVGGEGAQGGRRRLGGRAGVRPRSAVLRQRVDPAGSARRAGPQVGGQADVGGQPHPHGRGERPARLRALWRRTRRGRCRRLCAQDPRLRRPSAGRGRDPSARERRHPDLRPQGQCLRGGHPGRRARTMFKPDDGATYWANQKAGQNRRTAASRDRTSGPSDS